MFHSAERTKNPDISSRDKKWDKSECRQLERMQTNCGGKRKPTYSDSGKEAGV